MRLTSSRTLGVTTTWTGLEMVPPRIFHSRYSRRMTRSDHCRVCSSSFRLGFPFSPRGVSGLPSWGRKLNRLIDPNDLRNETKTQKMYLVAIEGK